MKISILIAHYNNWNYFQYCYQQIINQTYQNFEIIIVDDCSTDDSYNKLAALSENDSRIKLYRNTENKKVGFTKRRCIELATGDICAFVDPDDFLSIFALEEVINAYKTYPNIIATYSLLQKVNEQGKNPQIFENTRKIKNKNPLFFNIQFEVAHFFTFKKSFYDITSGIDDNLIISEDQDLYLKLYELGDFYFINKPLYNYRIHKQGISQNKEKTEQQKENWHRVILNTCRRREIHNLYGQKVESIKDLPTYIYQKENTILKKLFKKIASWSR